MYNVMWKAAMKHSYTDKKRAQKPYIATVTAIYIHQWSLAPFPRGKKLPAELPYKKNFPLNCTRTKEDEPTLYLDSYTRHPQTQTLPRSRAARELYFSANSDNLMSTAEKCHFSACSAISLPARPPHPPTVHPVWPTSPYCPITTSTHHTQSCQAGSTRHKA